MTIKMGQKGQAIPMTNHKFIHGNDLHVGKLRIKRRDQR